MSFVSPRAAVKTAWRLLVDMTGGVEAMAAACGISQSLVSEYRNRHGERFPPAQTIIAAERAAGEPLVTAALARAQGYELVLVDAPREQHALANIISEMGKNAGELFQTAAHALTHAKLTAEEHADLLREFGNLHRVAGEALTLLRNVEREG